MVENNWQDADITNAVPPLIAKSVDIGISSLYGAIQGKLKMDDMDEEYIFDTTNNNPTHVILKIGESRKLLYKITRASSKKVTYKIGVAGFHQ